MEDLYLTKEEAIAEHRKMWNWIADRLVKKGDPIYHKPMTENEAVDIIDDLSAELEEYEYPISDKQKEALELVIKKLKGEKNNEK